EFAPGTKDGDKLLAHELTHVVQGQKSGIQRKADVGGAEKSDPASGGDKKDAAQEVSDPSEPAEKEADGGADGVADQIHGDEKANEKGGKSDDKDGQLGDKDPQPDDKAEKADEKKPHQKRKKKDDKRQKKNSVDDDGTKKNADKAEAPKIA